MASVSDAPNGGMKENCVSNEAFWFEKKIDLKRTPSVRFASHTTANTSTVDVSMDLIVKCKCKSENHTRASDKKQQQPTRENRHSQ